MVPDHVHLLWSIPPIEEAVQFLFKLHKQRNAEIIVVGQVQKRIEEQGRRQQ